MFHRRLVALVLALALLAVPVLSLGESAAESFEKKASDSGRSLKTTVTFVPGEMLLAQEETAVVADLLKSMRLETTAQENETQSLGIIELFLQDKSSLSFAAQTEGDRLYLKSSLLGNSVLSFTAEEFLQLYVTVSDLVIEQMEQSEVDAQVIAETKAAIESYKASINSVLAVSKGDMAALEGAFALDIPEFDAQSLENDLMVPLQTWAANVLAAAVTTEGTFESELYGKASAKTVYSVTASDVKGLLQVLTDWAMKADNLDKLLELLASTSPENKAMFTDDVKAEIRKSLPLMPAEFEKSASAVLADPITVTLLMNETSDVVAAELNMSFANPDVAGEKAVFFLAGYTNKNELGASNQVSMKLDTSAEGFVMDISWKDILPAVKDGLTTTGAQFKIAISALEEGKEVFGGSLAFDSEEKATENHADETWAVSLDALIEGAPTGFSLKGKTTSDFDGTDVKSDRTVDAYMTGLDQPLLTIQAKTESAEAAAFPAVPTDDVKVGTMTVEEITAWGEQAYNTAMMSLMMAMQNLPQSVLQLFAGSGM